LGPSYSNEAIGGALEAAGQPATEPDDPTRALAELLAEGRVVALFQGGMEYGPRALGHRSILCRPDRPDLRDFINLQIKGREWFRPLAPCVLESRFSEVFQGSGIWPYMTVTFQVRPSWRDRLRGVTHIDGSARVQTVSSTVHSALYDVVAAFEDLTGIPVLMNTSFNSRGRPIVCTPGDAIETFRSLPIDALLIGGYLAYREGARKTEALVDLNYQSTWIEEGIESP
jgi:carbamoyltransferase